MPFFNLPESLGSHQLYYEMAGSGPLLLFLHNGFYSSISFREVMQELQDSFLCIAWDRQGYGRSGQPPTGQTSLASGAAEMDALLAQLHHDGHDTARITIWGHCMGGAIAVEWIARNPGRTDSLMLEACGFWTDPEIRRRADLVCRPWAKLPGSLRRTMETMHGENRAPQVWSQIIQHTDSYVMAADYDLRPFLPKIDCPVLVANGDSDLYFTRDHARAGAALLPAASLWLPDNCGHDLHLENGQQATAQFRKFQHTHSHLPA